MKNIFAILFLFVFLSACDEDDDINGSFEITVDNTQTEVSNLSGTLTVFDEQSTASGRSSHKLSIDGVIGDDSLNIAISNWDFQEPPEDGIIIKDYYNIYVDANEIEVGEIENQTCMRVSSNQLVCEGVVIKYKKGDKIFSSIFQDDQLVIVKITKCDSKKVSGLFNIMLKTTQEEEIFVSGEFVDIDYVVKNK